MNKSCLVQPRRDQTHGRRSGQIDDSDVRIVNRVMAEMPRPREIVSSTPGKFQVLWRVEGFTPEQSEAVTEGWRIISGDESVWDRARVLRLPGMRNTKYAEPF